MSEEGSRPICEQCGLTISECSALALAREAAESWLRDPGGYSGVEARETVRRLIPDRHRALRNEGDRPAHPLTHP